MTVRLGQHRVCDVVADDHWCLASEVIRLVEERRSVASNRASPWRPSMPVVRVTLAGCEGPDDWRCVPRGCGGDPRAGVPSAGCVAEPVVDAGSDRPAADPG